MNKNKYFLRLGKNIVALTDENGIKTGVVMDFTKTKELTEIFNPHHPLTDCYENNIKVGRYVVLGNKIKGAAIVASGMFNS